MSGHSIALISRLPSSRHQILLAGAPLNYTKINKVEGCYHKGGCYQKGKTFKNAVVWYMGLVPQMSAPLTLLQAWPHQDMLWSDRQAGWEPCEASLRVKYCLGKALEWLRAMRKPPTVSIPVTQFTDKQSSVCNSPSPTPSPPKQKRKDKNTPQDQEKIL